MISANEAPAIITPGKHMPEERFENCNDVESVFDNMVLADNPRASDRAKTQGMIDGNRPYSQAAMAKNAQGWRANVNYREGEGTIQANRTPYYDLVTEVDPCVSLDVEYGRDDQSVNWGQTIAREFHRMVFGWDSFDFHVQLRQSEMLTHGWGTHLWLGSVYDWRCRTKTMRHVLFPNGSTSDLEDLPYFGVRDNQNASRVWESIRNEKEATNIGWNVSAVKDALARASSDPTSGRRRTSEDVQAALKRGDLGHGYAHSTELHLKHLFVREFQGGKNDAGGITHYIVGEDSQEYLFRKRHRFEDFSQILAFFPYDIGSEGTIHSIRGLGTRIFPFMELSNRLKNHMVDAVLVGSGVLLSQKGSVDPNKLQLTSIGPMKILPPNVDVSAYKFPGLENGPLALSRELQETVQENTKTVRQGISDTQRERTAFEVSVLQADSATLKKSAHNMEYRNLDRWYREMLRRACNPNVTRKMPGGNQAVDFQEACMKLGVPKEAFAKLVNVQATRALGAGSASQRLTAIQAIMQTVYPTADEVSRNHMQRDYVAALVGSKLVNRYVPEIDINAVPTNDDSVAVLENDAMANGGDVIITPGQSHLRHAGRHLQKAAQLFQSISQGADPAQVYNAVEHMAPHIAAHLQLLGQDPTRKPQYEAMQKEFVKLSRLQDKLGQHLAEQQQAQAAEAQLAAADGAGQPQAPDPEYAAKMAEIEMDHDLKLRKLQGDQAIKRAKTESDIQMKDAKTAADISRKNRSQAAETVAKALPYARGSGTTES